MGPTRMSLSKPLIAAVNGYAVAGGLELALLADRASAYGQWNLGLDEALRAEGAGGVPIVAGEGASGAQRFVSGEGRHGNF